VTRRAWFRGERIGPFGRIGQVSRASRWASRLPPVLPFQLPAARAADLGRLTAASIAGLSICRMTRRKIDNGCVSGVVRGRAVSVRRVSAGHRHSGLGTSGLGRCWEQGTGNRSSVRSHGSLFPVPSVAESRCPECRCPGLTTHANRLRKLARCRLSRLHHGINQPIPLRLRRRHPPIPIEVPLDPLQRLPGMPRQ